MNRMMAWVAFLALCVLAQPRAAQAQAVDPFASFVSPTDGLDQVRTRDIDIPVTGGNLHATVTWTRRWWLQVLRREVVVMVSGPLLNARSLNVQANPNYNAGAILAQAGYMSIAIDTPGEGASFAPADGRVVTINFIRDRLREGIDWVRNRPLLLVSSVHAYGEGGKGGLALMALASEPNRLKSFGTTSQVYQDTTGVQNTLLSPFFYGFASSMPDGYLIPLPFDLAGTPADVLAELQVTQPMRYPLGYYFDAYNAYSQTPAALIVDPVNAWVPGFFATGATDMVSTVADNTALRNRYAYGHPCVYKTLAVLDSVNHAPFWVNYIDFLDRSSQAWRSGNAGCH